MEYANHGEEVAQEPIVEPHETQALESAGRQESLSGHEPLLEKLAAEDREIVKNGAQDNISRYTEIIDEMNRYVGFLQDSPARAESGSEAVAEAVLGRVQQDARRLGDTDSEVATAVKQAQDLKAALQQLSRGAKASDLDLDRFGIHLPRLGLPNKKGEQASRQLSEKYRQAQVQALRAAGIENPEDLLDDAAIADLVKPAASSEHVRDYLSGRAEALEDVAVEDVDPRLVAAVAVDMLDDRELAIRLKAKAAVLLHDEIAKLAPKAPSLRDIAHVYTDATLAGTMARVEVCHGLENRLIEAYQHQRLAEGMDVGAAAGEIRRLKREWEGYTEGAESRFARTSMRGDVMLEHHTPLALNIVKSGGLSPKSEHGRSTINSGQRSTRVHFSSRQSDIGPGHMNYRGVAELATPELRIAISEDPDLKPVAGAFAMPLAEAIKKGYNYALYTTKDVDGENVPEDILLGSSDGTRLTFGPEDLDLVVMRFQRRPQGAVEVPFDDAVEARLEELRAMHAIDSSLDWQELVRQRMDRLGIARRVFKDEGVDSGWADEHIYLSEEDVKAAHRLDPHKMIIPLARIHDSEAFRGETVDGLSGNLQKVVLGVVG